MCVCVCVCVCVEAMEWPEIALLQNEFPWTMTIHRLSSFSQSRVLN